MIVCAAVSSAMEWIYSRVDNACRKRDVRGRQRLWLGFATRIYGCRQKVRHAFAADLLSPFAVVDGMMAGDISENRKIEAANHFGVSQMVRRSQLISLGRLGRENVLVLACGEERDANLSVRP